MRQQVGADCSVVTQLARRRLRRARTPPAARLHWNEAGSLLASGSDDRTVGAGSSVACGCALETLMLAKHGQGTSMPVPVPPPTPGLQTAAPHASVSSRPAPQIMLWHYPDTARAPIAVETSHQARPCAGNTAARALTYGLDLWP